MDLRARVLENLIDKLLQRDDKKNTQQQCIQAEPVNNYVQQFPNPVFTLDQALRLQQHLNQSKIQQQEVIQKHDAAQTISLCQSLSPRFAFNSLYEWQQNLLLQTLTAPQLRNILISATTASGKTHLSSIFVLKTLIQQKKSCMFVVPYVALVDELTIRFKELLPSSCCLCSLTGLKPLPQFINNKPTLFIVTIEKANLLIKQMVTLKVVDKLGLVVVDEIHTSCDKNERGQKLELLICYFLVLQKYMKKLEEISKNKEAKEQKTEAAVQNENIGHNEGQKELPFQIIAMSATIDNHVDFKNWLNADLFQSNFRQVQLQETIFCRNMLYNFADQQKIKQVQLIDQNPLLSLLLTTKKPLIVFVATKKLTKTISTQFAQLISNNYKNEADDIKIQRRTNLLNQLTNKIPTIMQGVCQHSSDLLQADRQLIEEAFRENVVHTLVATTTLAAGVNLPAKSVIINGLKIGISQIDQQYYRQMTGRAGRTRESKEGYSILYLEDPKQFEEVKQLQLPYKCESQIFQPDFVHNTTNYLLLLSYQFKIDFRISLSQTLYAHQNTVQPQEFVENVHFLQKIGIIQAQNGQIQLTQLGKASNDAGFFSGQTNYYQQLIHRSNQFGFDIFSDDMIYLFLVYLPLQMYQKFESTTLEDSLEQEEQCHVNYEELGQLNEFVLKFLFSDFEDITQKFLQNNQNNKIKYYILYKVQLLKQAINALKKGNKSVSEDELIKSSLSLCGQLVIFCESMSYNNFKAILQQKQQEIRNLIEDDITDLLQIRYVGVFRARVLKHTGFNNAQDIVDAGLERLKLVLNFGEANDAAVQRVYDGALEVISK
ncbi:DNA_helicase [Hexamita inflata]|uniref:DNA helicase n=1 Tax=Hexamita inflata TaxID=28002 RepID=A0AA86N6Z9_9EUKA|nr:DNA helicase [Hexamita inflata]